jgi:hypothetical protein
MGAGGGGGWTRLETKKSVRGRETQEVARFFGTIVKIIFC